MQYFTGIRPILNAAVDPTNAADRSLLLPFSSHWAQISSSASCFANLVQVWVNVYPIVTHHERVFLD